MKKLLVVMLSLSLLVGMFSFASFADQGNDAVDKGRDLVESHHDDNAPSTTPAAVTTPKSITVSGADVKKPAIPSMEFNANAFIALLNKDASLDLSTGNAEDNADKVKTAYMNAFKPDFEFDFTYLKALREKAEKNWDTINSLNREIRKAFDKFKASLKGLSKADADKAMNDMKLTLNAIRTKITSAQAVIKGLRLQKENQWKLFRDAIRAHNLIAAQAAFDDKVPGTNDIIGLKEKIIAQQEIIIGLKNDIRSILPAKVQATPTFSPKSGAVLTGTAITIKSPGADTIYYTLDESVPTSASAIYMKDAKPVIAVSTTVKAIAFRAGVSVSAIGTAVYKVQPPATTPSSILLSRGAVNPVGTVSVLGIPLAGATTKGAVTGWIKNGTIKFTVADVAPAVSTITINGKPYVSGTDYQIRAPYHHLVIVVTTKETDKITCVRTFVLQVKK